MDSEIEYFDLFNIEYQDNILDIYYEVSKYCDEMGINLDKRSYGKFFEMIFRNVDIESSSEILKDMIKNENNELLMDSSDKEIDDYDDLY